MGPAAPRGKSPEQHLERGRHGITMQGPPAPERKLWPCLSPRSRVQSTSSGGICLKVLSSSWNLFLFPFEGDGGGQLGIEWEPKPCSYPEGHEEGGRGLYLWFLSPLCPYFWISLLNLKQGLLSLCPGSACPVLMWPSQHHCSWGSQVATICLKLALGLPLLDWMPCWSRGIHRTLSFPMSGANRSASL